MKSALLKMASMLLSLVVFTLAAFALHEWGHLQATRLLGGEGSMSYAGWFQGQVKSIVIPHHLGLVYWAGLAGPALLIPLWLWAHWTPTTWDLGQEAALTAVILAWTGYSVYEGLTGGRMTQDIVGGIYAAGTALGLGLYVKSLASWVRHDA